MVWHNSFVTRSAEVMKGVPIDDVGNQCQWPRKRLTKKRVRTLKLQWAVPLSTLAHSANLQMTPAREATVATADDDLGRCGRIDR